MIIRQWQALAALALTAVLATGCEQTPAQKQADQVRKDANNTADAVRNQTENKADALRDAAKGTENAGERKADAIEDAGERKADAIEANDPATTTPVTPGTTPTPTTNP